MNKTIKEEFTNERQMNFPNIEQAQTAIKKYIQFYNHQRPHRSIEWLTPNEAHNQTGVLNRKWKPYYKNNKNDLHLT